MPYYRDSQKAFQDAIDNLFLNENPESKHFAGNWMYMRSEGNRDYFKNINDRGYIYHTFKEETQNV